MYAVVRERTMPGRGGSARVAGAARPLAAAAARAPRRRVAALAAVLGAFLLAALFHVWSRLAVVDLGYRLAAARAAHAHLLEQNRRLKLELARLTAPARLAASARERFGLAPPAPSQIVHLGRAALAPVASTSKRTWR